MTEGDTGRQGRAMSGPEDVDGDWVPIFRMDDLPPGSEGPQIVVAGTTMASYPNQRTTTILKRARTGQPSSSSSSSSSMSTTQPSSS